MRLRLLVVLVVMALITAFVAFNWSVFVTSTPLNLGFVSFDAPLGLTMLGLVVTLSLVFIAYMAIWQSKILLDTRIQAKELQHQRTLADQAEASRLVELRTAMLAEFEQLSERMKQSQDALRHEMRDNANSLAAMLGELDDRAKKLYIEPPR